MRTVSFSSAPVQKLLNTHFVCGTMDIDGDPTAGASIGHAPTDSCGGSSRGIGRPNLQCLFLTPAGEILHVASGFVGPNDLAKEIRFALKVYDDVQASPHRAEEIVATLHRQRIKDLGYTSDGKVIPLAKAPVKAEDKKPKLSNRELRKLSARERIAQHRAEILERTKKKRNPASFLTNSGDDFDPRSPSGIHDSAGQRVVYSDHQFSVDYPMHSSADLLDNPRLLIGNSTTAYMSVGPGGASGPSLGGNGNSRVIIRTQSNGNFSN